MLIELDGSVPTANLSSGELAALENLAIAFVEGKHLIFAASATLQKLADCTEFGRRARGAFAAALARRAEIGALRRTLVRRLVVVGSLSTRTAHEDEILLPADWFANSGDSQASVLLVEDLNDEAVMAAVWPALAAMEGLPDLRLRWEVVSGGGSNTSREYARLQSSSRPALCLVDSDKWSSCAALGNTATGVSALDDAERRHVQVLILQAREMENLMPLAMIGFQTNLPTTEHHAFVDLKDGLRGFDLDNTLSESSRTKWCGVGSSRGDGCETGCVASRRKECTCQLIAGCGRKLLRRCCDEINGDGTTWLDGLVDWQKHEWRRIARWLVAWFAAPPALVT